jgi:hypothetical protein
MGGQAMSLLQRLQSIRSNKIIYNRLQRIPNPKPVYVTPAEDPPDKFGELPDETQEEITNEATLRILELQEELTAAEEEARAQFTYLSQKSFKR